MFRFGEMYERLKDIAVKPWLGKMMPFRIIGGVYFVGTYQASCHLVDTGDGLIMIDPGYSKTAYLVLDSIYRLGFHPQDIKYIVNTHWHADHAEATEAFSDLTGAKTLIGRDDAEKAARYFTPDILVDDGDTLTLGNTRIRFVHTPGHTKGTISFFFDVEENGKTYRVGSFGGAGTNTMVRKAFDFDGCREAYLASLNRMRKETKPVVYKTSKLIRRVIVTANSDISNALVESLRKDMKIPYIMIIDGKDQPDAATRVAFFPPRAEEPLMLTAKDLSKLLAYLRPEDVIFLGSADLLPDFYTKAVTGRTRVLRVNDSDWTKNAYKLSHILNSAKPAKAYQDHIARRKAEQEKRQAAYDAAVKAAQDADAKARQLEGELIKSVK